MPTKTFRFFAEAKDFAKQHAPAKVLREGGHFVVAWEARAEVDPDPGGDREVKVLREELHAARQDRERLIRRNGRLQDQLNITEQELSALQATWHEDFKVQVEATIESCKEQKRKLKQRAEQLESQTDQECTRLRSEREEAEKKKSAYQNKYKELVEEYQFIIRSLKDRFGEFRVLDEVKEHQERFFCSRCGGDGNDGNCPKCDGTGWEERIVFDKSKKLETDANRN